MSKNLNFDDPIDIFLFYINNKTKTKIIKELFYGTKSFNELCKSTRCIPWTLKLYLKQLTKNKIITTTVYPEIPIRTEYTLTQLGESMKPIITAMVEWGFNYKNNDK